VTKELEILEVLSGQVRRPRAFGTSRKIDDNDDELIKSLGRPRAPTPKGTAGTTL